MSPRNEIAMSGTVKNTSMVRMRGTTRLNELEELTRYLKKQTERILDDGLPILMRIQAIKDAEEAIRCAVNYAPDDGLEIVVYPHADNYLKGLVRVGRMPMSEEYVYSVLGHIHTAFSFNGRKLLGTHDDTYERLAASYVAEVWALAIKTLTKFRRKFDTVKMCDSILEEISGLAARSYPECTGIIAASGLIPILANMIITHSMYGARADGQENEEAISASNGGTIVAHALNILDIIIAYYNPGELPISALVEAALPVFHSLLNSNDCKILKNGGLVINEFLARAGVGTITLRFANGKTGVQYVLLIAAHILSHCNARPWEYSVLSMIREIQELQEFIEGESELCEGLNTLLEVLVNKLRHCTGDPDATEYFLLMFSYLMQIDCKAVINFLSDSVEPSGQNSLRIVIVDGLCRNYESLAEWNRETAKLALKEVYKYGVAHPESKLHGEILEAVRALLLSLDAGDVGGTNVVDETLADHAEVVVRT